ncbi:hypothetical protein Tco_0092850 [Tanacetum coccineum]
MLSKEGQLQLVLIEKHIQLNPKKVTYPTTIKIKGHWGYDQGKQRKISKFSELAVFTEFAATELAVLDFTEFAATELAVLVFTEFTATELVVLVFTKFVATELAVLDFTKFAATELAVQGFTEFAATELADLGFTKLAAFQSKEGNADSSKALDAGLVVTESNGTESERHVSSSRFGKDTHAEDAHISSVNDK